MVKRFKYILFPVSVLYSIILWIRNKLYDWKILKSATFNFPIICVGNLAVGGTGKTPMTEYLITLLKEMWITATLSRGYKRKTKGFAIAGERTTAIEIGDEPMQFHQKFPDVTVAVGEERLVAIPQILHARPDTEVIILDDAFQHRTVTAGLNILLTECNNLYTRDHVLPMGDLRDLESSSKRAEVLIVTKCSENLSQEEKERIKKELKPTPKQVVFFTAMAYDQPYHLFNGERINISQNSDVLLVCGIANPLPLKEHLATSVRFADMLRFPDHHIFRTDDLNQIKKQFTAMESENKIIITTEKDAVRLEKFRTELADFPLYVLPVKHRFLFNEGQQFEALVHNFIRGFNRQS